MSDPVFPVYLGFGPVSLHPHFVLEALAYVVGAVAYVLVRRRYGDPLGAESRWTIAAAAFVGAALGSKLMYWVSDIPELMANVAEPEHWLGGKSIVGGLVGALVAVEVTKRIIGERRSSGDLYAVPLALGIAVGRIGCFLTGLDDHTHGVATTLPWAVDYGDGVLRHPAQLYEVGFLVVLAAGLLVLMEARRRDPGLADRLPQGAIFALFMVSYLLFRLALEWIKPGVFYGGLNAIQWVCLGGLLWYAWLATDRQSAVRRWLSGPPRSQTEVPVG